MPLARGHRSVVPLVCRPLCVVEAPTSYLAAATTSLGKKSATSRHQRAMKIHQACGDGLRVRQAPDEAIPWRRRSLRHAGFPARLAASAAAQPHLDLHAVLQLVDLGWPPELAIAIMEPLPTEMRS